MRSAITARATRIAFATTVHGYEGTGRGFALRFLDELRRSEPRRSFARELPHQLSDPLRDLDPNIAVLALDGADPGARPALLPGDLERLDACAGGPLPYDLVVRPALELVTAAVVSGAELPADDARLLVMKVLQKRPWDEVTEALALGTVPAAMRALRRALAPLVAGCDSRWR